MWWRVFGGITVAVLAGCGRIGFQGSSGASDAPGTADTSDAPPLTCDAVQDLACTAGDGCTPLPAGAACGDRLFCDGAGACRLTVRQVGCDTPVTGHALCQDAGFSGAERVTGYYWFQCQGYADRICPGTGWDFEAMTCTTWCGNQDCTQVDYCGAGYTAYELSGDGATSFDPLAYGLDCQSYNPGWLVLARCYR